LDSGADLIVVGGGDGTRSEATHQLAHRDVCLGVLPFGTTNNFARSLGLPLHLPAALRILTEGKPSPTSTSATSPGDTSPT
jgi:diacylglycerol kinase family enzyme